MGSVFFPASSCYITLVRSDSLLALMGRCNTRVYNKKSPPNIRYQGHTQFPPDLGVNLFLKKPDTVTGPSQTDSFDHDTMDSNKEEEEEEGFGNDVVWDSGEIEAISSLFKGRIPQKPGSLNKERPLPLPLPHKLRPLRFPTPKRHVKLASPKVAASRAFLSKQAYKSPTFLVGLARDISKLTEEEDASVVLDQCARFLRKGSLSLTIRELGHMGLPARALQTFSWAQKQPLLYPDDLVMASTVEVLARNHKLKVPLDMEKFVSVASRGVVEALVKGFIRGGSLRLALKLLKAAKKYNRMLDSSVYVKLILELGKNPEKQAFVVSLLNDLGEREDMKLSPQDYSAIMKICIKLGKFDMVKKLFKLFKQEGNEPSLVMYTTLIHSYYSAKEYREAMALVWEMESSECLFDLPAYRVVTRLFVALDDLPRAVRYFSKLKEAGFSPTYDIYRNLIQIYMASGRLAMCKRICKEAELSGFKLDEELVLHLSQLERETKSATCLGLPRPKSHSFLLKSSNKKTSSTLGRSRLQLSGIQTVQPSR